MSGSENGAGVGATEPSGAQRELRLGELVLRAAALDSDEREAFLRRAAADDPELVAAARDRLAEADDMPSSFLAGATGLGARALEGGPAEDRAEGTQADAEVVVVPVPEEIGPYRVVRRLGAGGMGEVYEGYDDRLDRPVALKRIRREADGLASRARFRHEARAVARLSHPSIVQVHDWVEADDGDWIVMERVDGRSLREILAAGPLEPEPAARLARDVAAGLAAAHSAGIVHRDLKAGNVMVTAGERAKILDFGIAKRLSHEPAAPLTAVTTEGKIIGTVSAMSPEQAKGLKVDHRSDLFSLGMLFYEMVTGVAPFERGSAIETLTHICTVRQPPAAEANPAVPPALSAWIDRLLEKEPEDRPQSAGEVVAALEEWLAAPATGTAAAAASAAAPVETAAGRRGRRWASRIAGLSLVLVLAGLGAQRLLRGEPPEPIYVAVPETEVVSAEGRELRLAASAVRTALLRGLLGFQGVVAVEPSDEEADLADPAALAQALAADEVLTSRLECEGASCQVTLKRLGGESGQPLWTRGLTVDPEGLVSLSQAVVEHLRSGYPDRGLRPGVPDLEVRPEDYRDFLRLKERFDARAPGTSLADIREGLERLQRSSPRFIPPYLLQAGLEALLFEEERDPEALSRALEIIERARAVAPDDPRVLIRGAYVSRKAGDLETAAATLATLLRREPGNAQIMVQRAQLLEKQGQSEEALSLMRRAVERQPSLENLVRLADMDYRQGDMDAARSHLEAALEHVSDHFDTRSRLALLELLSGSPERAVELYEDLVRRSPGSAELTNLGVGYMLTGRWADAARCFRQALEQAPRSAIAVLNLADAELLHGDDTEADALYRSVVERVDQDPDPDTLLTVRAQALAHLGEGERAVADIQRALRLAPEDPHVVYEAALVYALLGEETSALWNARRALELGIERRWFSFPWFDALRPRLEQEETPLTRESAGHG